MTVALLCHFDGTSGSTVFVDASGYHTLTASGATVNTAAPKFGAGAGDFTSSSAAYIAVSNPSDFLFGAGQFTLEAQVYFTSTPGTGGPFGILSKWGSASSPPNYISWWFGHYQGNLTFFYSTDGTSATAVSAALTPTLNTWYHVAVDRDASNVVRLYVNGAVVASATVAVAFYASPLACVIGNDNRAAYGFPGRLDEARVTVGLAQYGGAFTPPSAPFSDPSHPYTSWNPLDTTSGIALSNNNLTVSGSNSNQGIRAANPQSTGKYYFEITLTTLYALGGQSIGLATAGASLSASNGLGNCVGIQCASGNILVNATNSGTSIGARSSGDIVGIAVDLTNELIWFRVAPSGNWNGNAAYAPGGSGGVSFSTLGGVSLYPLFGSSSGGFGVTANFGDTSFSGAVPSGFTSGWPTVALSLVDLVGNLGGSSQYGKLLYGKGQFSRIGAFAPIFAGDLTVPNPITFTGNLAPAVSFAADLDVHVNIIDLAGGITPQIALGGPLTVLSLGLVFDGSLSFTPILGASSFVSGSLWADSEPCPPSPWTPSEPCPPSMWTPIGPCDPVEWKTSELCNG